MSDTPIRTAVGRYRAHNDALEERLGLDPKKRAIEMAKEEVLRYARLVAQSPLPRVVDGYVEAARRLHEAEAAVRKP